ncbi:MAG TPA: glucan biosynthesis protein, partial [Verrucomicrobiae bacterium]|nr:glucan biosynthesis protein [Verrucomicrobiae bacterium]
MQELNHRNSTGLLVAVVGVAASVFWCGTIDSAAQIISANVDFSYVVRRAEARAREPFIPPDRNVPECLRRDRLNEAQYQQIHFRHERALWAADGLPFRLEFFHPGDVYQDPVHLSEFSAGYVQPIRFVQDFFRYGQLRLPQLPADTGYAGFRILHQLNTPAKWDELGAFLGGTYFRLLGKGQRYGQYARGLALDCGEPDRPEEFPLFTDWWIAKPSPGSSRVHAIALLDSASATGAYEFKIVPGRTTIAEIQA